MTGKSQPIVVIKKKSAHGGHHGGAWKVAYADFVTAMMSLFIVLWLMNQSEQVKKAVAGYFNTRKVPPVSSAQPCQAMARKRYSARREPEEARRA